MIKNLSKNTVLAEEVEVTDNFICRAIGLLKRKQMNKGEALVIKPCNAIHTFFMRFPIDVVFLDQNYNVVKIAQNLAPFRMTLPKLRAKLVIEFPAGVVKESKTEIGDTIKINL